MQTFVLLITMFSVSTAGYSIEALIEEICMHGHNRIVGEEIAIEGYISSSTEFRLYDRLEEDREPIHCISGIYGASVNRSEFLERDGEFVQLQAVVAEYRDGIIIGANQALGERGISAFSNHCDQSVVLVITKIK